jgi:hypothetical protein
MKGRKHRESGGSNLAADDLKDKPKDRTEPSGPSKEAEEMKKGGRAHKRHGGSMKAEGEKKAHAHRKPRKSGGRATSDANPFTSARSGKHPPGRSEMGGKEGFGED